MLENQIISVEPVLRAGSFIGVLAVMLVLEARWPRRARVQARIARWRTNGALVLLDTVLARGVAFIAPLLAATGAATWAQAHGIGLFNIVALPALAEIVLAALALDAAVWAQHVAFHRVPFFWRFHRVHHADRDLDASSGLRFHPAEIVVSMIWKAVVVVVLGAPVVAVIVFEVLLNATAMFNHANVKLPAWLDRALRLVLVTPDMHRVHHSVRVEELNTNFGFCLSLWDRASGLYCAQPQGGHEAMTVGLAAHQDEAPAKLGWSLVFPVKR
ncbi:MAG: sterol desaturase family protein [Hyphomonadaceae bacterium]|nr:sterol desaturase family protein [Hyphomonadaceae bacterium]